MLMEKVLIIGSSGFLGSTIKKKLIQSNKFEVVEILGKNDLDVTDINLFESFVKNKNINTIINCAAFVGGISFGYKYQKKLLEENTKIALNIYNLAYKYKIKKIINPISNCVYPGSISEYSEELIFDGPPHESVYFYAMSKRFLIDLSKSYYLNEDISSFNLIMSNMYGPNDHFNEDRSHALGALVKKIYDAKLNKTNVEIWGSGNQEREWLYVEDGAEAILRTLELKNDYQLFNVGVNKTISIKDLANLIAQEIRYKGDFTFNLEKPEGVLKKSVNGSKGETILKWKPKTDITIGIRETVKWYKVNNEK